MVAASPLDTPARTIAPGMDMGRPHAGIPSLFSFSHLALSFISHRLVSMPAFSPSC